MERTAVNSWFVHQVSDWYSSILFWGRPVFPEKNWKSEIQSSLYLLPSHVMSQRFAEILARSLKNQNKREKLLQETSGFFLSSCTPAESSRELCKTFLGRFCQVIFREPFFFSWSNSSLSYSPNIIFNKAVVRSQSWRPVVLQSHFSSGCSWPWWLLRFILLANLHTWAKSLYLFSAHKSPLVPWKVATCCQLSQGSRVLKANQGKADWTHKQNSLPADL